MAVRKNKKDEPKGSQAVVIFWLVFVIIIIGVFMLNAETIQRNFNVFLTRLTSPGSTAAEEDFTVIDEESEWEPSVVVVEPPRQTQQQPQTQQPLLQQPQVPQTPQTQQPQTPVVQTRDRVIYYTQVNNDGQILQSRVTRRIPVSQSPMQDALNVLLAGPSAEELNRGMINLIPQNTRMLSAAIRGNTAYISFSEDFLFNTFGVEGYIAQLRQIVWTVTEFQNVSDVQILIEGRRMDYLGEGIWIGSPISRQSF
ncbi:MAG: GerMN domain-containing protein [Treponema sp.]|nr:GerMN domain-containing protein [Treponema sp.]